MTTKITSTITSTLAALILSLTFAALASAQNGIYKWQDEKGLWHFSQQKPENPVDRAQTENLGDYYAGTQDRQISDFSERATKQVMAKCAREWPTQYTMQEYCHQRQLQGFGEFLQLSSEGIPADKFRTIRVGCMKRWGSEDFVMATYCAKGELDAYRRLNAGR